MSGELGNFLSEYDYADRFNRNDIMSRSHSATIEMPFYNALVSLYIHSLYIV